MLKISAVLMTNMMLSSIANGALPGSGGGWYVHRFTEQVYTELDGAPMVNELIQANVTAHFDVENQFQSDNKYTNEYGDAYFSFDFKVPDNYDLVYWQAETIHHWICEKWLVIEETNSNYIGTSHNISVTFILETANDFDNNGIDDSDEIPLAEKFCPTYVLNSATDFVKPEPVQYLGVEKEDLWFYLVNNLGQTVGDYKNSQQSSFDPPVSSQHSWVGNNYEFSHVHFEPAYSYTGNPPPVGYSNPGYGQYLLRFHWNYAGTNCNSESCWSSYYDTEREQNANPNTLYVHLFIHNSYVIIQYWSYYPYNDFINNHEGDWEHINVWITSDNPSTATIHKVEYYFHQKYLVRYPGGFQTHDGTHPKVYVGGQNTAIAPGVHSGGNYPEADRWVDISPSPTAYDEWVLGQGPTISYNTFYDNDPEDHYGIVILPDLNDVEYDCQPDLSWFKAEIPWGHIDARSYADWIEKFQNLPFIPGDIGNDPPPSPAYRAGWNDVGSAGGGYDPYSSN